MVIRYIVVDPSKCTGCRYCEVWCSFVHEGVFSSSLSRITVVKDDVIGLDYPVVCKFCDPALCIESCPSNALIRNENNVIVVIEEKCIGCSTCINVCPYGAIKMHPIKAIPLICDLCGGEPVCISKCPTNALSIHPINEIDIDVIFDKSYSSALKHYQELLKRWGFGVK